jgi:hypothetical protein
MSDGDNVLGMTRLRSKVAKRRADEEEPYEFSEEISYHDSQTGQEIADPERIRQFEETHGGE